MSIDNAFGNLMMLFMGGVVIALSFTAVDRLCNSPWKAWKPKPRKKK